MSTVLEPSSPELTPQPDPFRYGWRYVRRPEADGTVTTVRIPLRREDVLHPQEDDFIVQNETHEEDCDYLKAVLKVHLADKAGIHVFRDLRMDWGVPDIEPHGPDLAVIANVPEGRPPLMGTLHLAESGARPLLVIEVTSPSTRDVDLDEKVDEYYQAGIPFYAIVDRWLRGGVEQVRLLAYRWAAEGYVRLTPDSEGWLALEPIGLFLAFEGRNLVCRDAQGQRILDYVEAVRSYREREANVRRQAEAQIQAETQARQQAEAAAAADRARAEAAEERNRQLEAEIKRLRGQP
jgi:hypothetical protein